MQVHNLEETLVTQEVAPQRPRKIARVVWAIWCVMVGLFIGGLIIISLDEPTPPCLDKYDHGNAYFVDTQTGKKVDHC